MTRRQTRGPMFKNRIVGHGYEAPDQLLANPHNWRTHPDIQANELEKILETVGWIQDVIINQRTGHMVDGHLRAQLAMRRDEPEVPVTYIDISLEEELLMLAVYDPIGALATRDRGKLSDVLADTKQAFPESDVDFAAILGADKKRAKGLAHDVKECACCKEGCRPGCGCYREP